MTKYLIAGGAGFMGSNFVRTTLQRKDYVINIDSLTYAGSIELLSRTFIQAPFM